MAMHAGELPIDAAVVRDLIYAQFPQWRGLHVRRVTSSGTDNAIFRLGSRLAARFSLQGAEPAATRRELESEAAAARDLAATRFAVPALVALGEPGPGYPLPWPVHTWLPGRTGEQDDPSGEMTFAADLAEFIAAVRAIGTRGRTFSGRGRGGDLQDHDDWMYACFRESEGFLDVRRLTQMWAAFRELPREAPDVMSHGDLTPGNVLISGGHLVGVLDLGCYGAADPALDLISAWNMLEAGPRQVLRTGLRCTDLEWERSKAWAFQQAMGLVWYYADSNPVMSRLGRITLNRIMAAAEVLPEPLRAASASAPRWSSLNESGTGHSVRDYQAMASKPVTPGNGLNLSPFITPMRPRPAFSLVPIAILPVELTQYREMPVGAWPWKWTRPTT
jgi:aminoglycoside phosphotransferase (APT) family kinase protein